MRDDQVSRQFDGSIESVTSYEAELTYEQANVHVTEHNLRVCAANHQWNEWWQVLFQGEEAYSCIWKRENHSRSRMRLRPNQTFPAEKHICFLFSHTLDWMALALLAI